ncbi:MAG: MATE family efflux transporter [Eubacteriales bacterium]|nr:MATE family efflux transporter [Eubacteriales bacterium]
MKKYSLEEFLKQEKTTRGQEILLILVLSIPAILAEFTSIAMQYIDAGMVGSLGAEATGAIGLVVSTTWLMNGMCIGMSSGFSVQVAQLVGAGRKEEAKNVLRQSLVILLLCGLALMAVGAGISPYLPIWLGGEARILKNASIYFFIYACSLPFAQVRQLCAAMMQCSGDMKTPSVLSAFICLLDVVFNFFFIFPSRMVELGMIHLWIPGVGLGVRGAALGTTLSEVVVSLIMLYALCVRSPILNLKKKGSWKWKRRTIYTAVKIAVPMTLDHVFLCSAYVFATRLISPLGTIAVAANSLAVTAESLCYMPGYGIGAASTAIIGQTIGAGRRDLTKSFSRLTVFLGMFLMGLAAIFMYILSPFVFHLLTSDPQVAMLGTKVLRVELFAEPLFAASICCAGVFRGAGDTLFPSIMNLASMWGVRIVLSTFFIPIYGLLGFWIAMCIELAFRGSIFLIRLFRDSWMKKALIE